MSFPQNQIQGANGSALANDPLAGKTPKQVFERCVWGSDEPAAVKILLLCVGRFFDAEARASSMSYSQISRDCGLSERKAKQVAQQVVGRWLEIEVGKGFYVAGHGHQNLYHGIIPPDVVQKVRYERALRIERRKVTVVAEHEVTTITGVHVVHPAGVHVVHPGREQSETGVHGLHDRGAQGAHILRIDSHQSSNLSGGETIQGSRVLIDDDYLTFCRLANGFGQPRGGSLVMKYAREDTDPLACGLIDLALAKFNADVVKQSWALTALNVEALGVEERNTPATKPRSQGVTSFQRYWHKTLIRECETLCLDTAKARGGGHGDRDSRRPQSGRTSRRVSLSEMGGDAARRWEGQS